MNNLNPILSHRKNGKMLVRCVPCKGQYIFFFMRAGNLWVRFPYNGEYSKLKNAGDTIFNPRLQTIFGHYEVVPPVCKKG